MSAQEQPLAVEGNDTARGAAPLGELIAERHLPDALALVGHVHDRDEESVADLLHGLDVQGLYAVAVTCAALVDDTKTVNDLLSWLRESRPSSVAYWRQRLTPAMCRSYHSAFVRGERTPDVVDGHREYQRRRGIRLRMERAAS